MTLQFDGSGLTRDPNIKAPTYDDPFVDMNGSSVMMGYNPMLAATLNAGTGGGIRRGLGAFMGADTSILQASGEERQPYQGAGYNEALMGQLAQQMGIDTGGRTGKDLQAHLDSQLQDYRSISGLSGGWNPTNDPRQANQTIYRSEGGKLVPYQTEGYHQRERGSWLQENQGILAPLAVATGGLAYGAFAGAGAGAGAGAAAGAGGGAGATGAGAVGGAAGAAGGGAGLSGISGTIATALGPQAAAMWGGLSAWQQAAIIGSLQGGGQAALTGGNVLRGMAMGGITGGLGSWAGPAISSATGMPAWAGRAVASAGIGGLTGGVRGAIGGGLGSLATTGLGEAGVNSTLAGRLGGMAGSFGANALMGEGAPSRGGAGGPGGPGGGGGMAGGVSSAPGASKGPGRTNYHDAGIESYLNETYAPVALAAQRRKLAEQLAEMKA